MPALSPEDLADLRRWLIAGAVVVLAHGSIAATMVRWRDPVVDPDEPAGVVVMELAPEQIAAREQSPSDAVPEKPIEKVEKELDEPVEPKGELPTEQKAEPKPPEEQPREARPLMTPQPELPKVAALPAAPVQGNKPIDSKALQLWSGEIAAALERKKRYPPEAHARRVQGVALVSFTLDQHGHVLESHIERSSGAADLDAEALALLYRAQPFPPGSGRGITAEQVRMTVPIRFSLR
jgi:protein TonB